MTQNFDSKYLEKASSREVNLEIINDCFECGYTINDECENHEGFEDSLTIKVRKVPWSKRNQLMTDCVSWDEKGGTLFNGDLYLRECLKYMIVEAPWGLTNDVFLSQVGEALGTALEKLVPKANAGSSTRNSIDSVKKER